MTTPTIDQYRGIRQPEDIDDIIDHNLALCKWTRTNKRIAFLNAPLAFDIESTSFYENEEKRAIMYGWTLGLNGEVILGRTWEQFVECMEKLSERLELGPDRRVLIYVHNLAFDFQFFRKWLEWTDVFALSERKPVYARSALGIEFRCSYILTGYSLEKLSDLLTTYHVEKAVGDLDYSLIRHSSTELTAPEVHYMENDVRVIMAYIQEQIEKEGNITRIPLTKTGYVRRYCRNACLYDKRDHKKAYQYFRYRRIIGPLTLEEDEYRQLKRAFQGGFTHANAFRANRTWTNVESLDFTSSYPAVMIAEKFPMSKGQVIQIRSRAELKYNLIRYCCLFDIEFEGLECDTLIDHPISLSKCWDVVNVSVDNGRVVSADRLRTTITGEDFEIIDKFYTWSGMKIGTFRRYQRGYLPTVFVKAILELYRKKTELKGVKGEEEVFINSKEQLNACYGMTVTDIIRDEITYSGDEWSSSTPDLSAKLAKENDSKRRFLFYPWGVWVTAYARRNLFEGIYACGLDYCYSDTDSIKTLNYDKHKSFFEDYNRRIVDKLRLAMDHHGLDYSYIAPKNIKGVEKPLGVWDDEGEYIRFKSLGAKRYITQAYDIIKAEKHFLKRKSRNLQGRGNGKYHLSRVSITVSGVNKKYAVPYMMDKFHLDVFERFEDSLSIPAGHTGKSTHTYIDDEIAGDVTDYNGKTSRYYERSAVHLEQCGYDMSLSAAYLDYLMGIEEFYK